MSFLMHRRAAFRGGALTSGMVEFFTTANSKLEATNTTTALDISPSDTWGFSWWMRSSNTDGTNKRIFSLHSPAGQVANNIQIVHDNGYIHPYFNTPAFTPPSSKLARTSMSDGNLHHVGLVWTGDSYVVTVDAQIVYTSEGVGSGIDTSLLNSGTHRPMFGQYATGSFNYEGDLSYFSMHKNVTVADICEMYNGGEAIAYGDLSASLQATVLLFYKFDSSSDFLLDSGPNGVHLTNSGDVAISSTQITSTSSLKAPYGPSMALLSAKDQIDLGDWTIDQLHNATEFTIGSWVNISDHGYMWNSWGMCGILSFSGTDWRAYVGTSFYNFGTDANMSQYYGKIIHLAYTYDGSDIRIYINGSNVATGAMTGTLPASSTYSITINRYQTSNDSDEVSTSEFRIWDRALSSLEMTEWYNSGVSLPYSSMSVGLKTNLISAYELNSNDTTMDDVHGSGDTGVYIQGAAGDTLTFDGPQTAIMPDPVV